MLSRTVVIGTTGSGKSTLARKLSERLGVPYVELDSLHWEPNWIEAEDEIFRQRVASALQGERWVVDGNYGKVRDLVWPNADTIVWLDYSLATIFWQLFRRTMRRVLRKETLWNGCTETWQTQFLTQDSLFLWAWQTHPRHRREYPLLFKEPEFQHLQVIHLKSPADTERWWRSRAQT